MTVALSGRLPADWEPQSGIMLTWPRQDGDFARNGNDQLLSAEISLLRIAAITSRQQRVLLIIEDHSMATRLRILIEEAGGSPNKISFIEAPADDIWARDHGPLTIIKENRPLLLNFRFDGWGKRFPANRDNAINEVVHDAGGFGKVEMLTVDQVLEGGAIESDGAGTLITTRSWLERCYSDSIQLRNNIRIISQLLDIKHFIVINHGKILGDDTAGHVDTLVRFANPGTLLYQSCAEADDPNFESLDALANELRELRQLNGRPFDIHPLPFPGNISDADGNRLPASYANFLLCGQQVLVPGFGSPADHEALETISRWFPDRQAVSIDCLPLIAQGGGLHCAAMQLPAGLLD